MSASLLHFAAAKHTPFPARLPHSAGALRALTIHETVERPRRFLIRFALQNPRRGVPPSAPPFPRNVRFAPSTLPLRTYAFPRSLTTFRGRATRDVARETEERPRRFFIRFALQNPRIDARRPLLPFRVMSASLLHFAVTNIRLSPLRSFNFASANIRPSPLAYHIPRARSARYCPRDGRVFSMQRSIALATLIC